VQSKRDHPKVLQHPRFQAFSESVPSEQSVVCVCVFSTTTSSDFKTPKEPEKKKKEHQLQLSFKFGETKSCTTPQRHYVAV